MAVILKGYICPDEIHKKHIVGGIITKKQMQDYCKNCHRKCKPLLVSITKNK